MDKHSPIAVFDSGVGGLSVLAELWKQMPEEHYLYYGDSARAPYGDKPIEEVRALTLRAAGELAGRGIKALVVACNTATSAAIHLLREQYPQLIVVGIEPALKVAADRFPEGSIGVMATQFTLREEKFAHQAQRFPAAHLIKLPAPGLVELIEEGKADSPETEALLRPLLAPYAGQLDALVLGCTHYPFAAKVISRLLPGTLLVDGGAGTARQTQKLLRDAGLLHSGPGSIQIENSRGDPSLVTRSMQLLQEAIHG